MLLLSLGWCNSCHRRLLCPFILNCFCSHQHHGKSCLPAVYIHLEDGTWTSTWFLGTAKTMNFNMVFSGIKEWGHQQRPMQIHGPKTPSELSDKQQAKDSNMSLGYSTVHGHQHSFRQQYRLLIDLHVAFIGNPSHRQQHRHQLQKHQRHRHGPQK